MYPYNGLNSKPPVHHHKMDKDKSIIQYDLKQLLLQLSTR